MTFLKKSVGSSVGRAKVMYYIFLEKEDTAIWIFWELWVTGSSPVLLT